MFRLATFVALQMALITVALEPTLAGEYGTADEAKAMLERAVAAVKEDKAKALDAFNKGEGGFKDRDLYVFCANAFDGILTAHPFLKGEQLQDIKGKKGFPLGQEIMQNAAEGTIKEITYWWPRPGTDKPLEKTHVFHKGRRSRLWCRLLQAITCRTRIFVAHDRMRQSRLLKIQYAAITAMKNDMRSAKPAMAAIMVA